MQRVLGIDLGTTNSVMACIDKGQPQVYRNRENDELTPSCVALNRDGSITVGRTAKQKNDKLIISIKRFMGRKYADPEVQNALKRMKLPYKVTEGMDGGVRVWLGDRDYSPEEISACILRKLKEDADRPGKTFTRAVISVPAYFHEPQVAATREAGRLAGLHVMKIVREPTAAATAYGLLNSKELDGKTILVYDLGGGTFDVSIMMVTGGVFTVLRTDGDLYLGGDNFDQLIVDHIIQSTTETQQVQLFKPDTPSRPIRPLILRAEESKIALSSDSTADVNVPAFGVEGVDIELTVARQQFEAMICQLIERSIEITHKTISEAGLTMENIDAVLLVGGSTFIPLVEKRLIEEFGAAKIRKDTNPMLCVAQGAAIQSTLMAELECPNCQTLNPVQNDFCTKCQTPLFGTDAPIMSVIPGFKGTTDGTPVSTPTPDEPGELLGLKCKCGHIHPPGTQFCPLSGEPVAVSQTIDVMPHPIGIELQDGRFSVLVDRGATVPVTPQLRPYRLSAPGQSCLDVNVYEGSDLVAVNNELIGVVPVDLQRSYPKDTPVGIAIGLDSDSIVSVIVKIGLTNAEPFRVTLERHRPHPELRQTLKEARDRLTLFTNQWQEELTVAEKGAFTQLREYLDNALRGGVVKWPSKAEIDALITKSNDTVDICADVRGADARLSNAIHRVGDFLTPDQTKHLASLALRIEQAREQANWDVGRRIVAEVDSALDALGDLMAIVYAQAHADQNRLSPALAHRVQSAIAAVRAGVKANDAKRVGQGMQMVLDLWPEINVEVEKNTAPVQQSTRPTD